MQQSTIETNLTTKRGVVAYLFLTFGLAWLIWIGLWLAGYGPGSNTQLFYWLSIPGGFAPAIAAIIVRRWITREGFADAGLSLNFRRKWRYYLAAWLLPPALIGAVIILAPVLGITQPDFSLTRAYTALGQPSSGPSIWLRTLTYLGMALPLTLILWGEEFGWRGYLQIRLLARRPLAAAIVTGLIWGIWHYPLILMGLEYPDHRLMGLVVFPLTTIFYSIVLGWLKQQSGSIWPPSLFHAAMNTLGGNILLLLFLGGPYYIWVSFEGVLIWIPFAFLSAWIIFTGQLQPAAAFNAE